MLAEIVNQLIESVTHQQLGRIGRDRSREDDIEVLGDQIRIDHILNVFHGSRKEVGDACVALDTEHFVESSLTDVEVDEHYLLIGKSETGGKVGGDESLARSHNERGEHDHLAVLALLVFHILQV